MLKCVRELQAKPLGEPSTDSIDKQAAEKKPEAEVGKS